MYGGQICEKAVEHAVDILLAFLNPNIVQMYIAGIGPER